MAIFFFFLLLIILLIAALCLGGSSSYKKGCNAKGCKVPKKKKCCKTIPDPVALNVHVGPAEVPQAVAPVTTAAIIYDTTSLNLGGWTADITNSIYTVPATGYYDVTWTVNSAQGSENPLNYQVDLYVDGTLVPFAGGVDQSTSEFINTSSGGKLQLLKGQTVELRITNNSEDGTLGVYQSTLGLSRFAV